MSNHITNQCAINSTDQKNNETVYNKLFEERSVEYNKQSYQTITFNINSVIMAIIQNKNIHPTYGITRIWIRERLSTSAQEIINIYVITVI
jgi:hypothetical protein